MAHTPGPYIIGEPGGPSGPFYSIVNSQGNVVAMQVLNYDDALLWKAAPGLLTACEVALNYLEHQQFEGWDDAWYKEQLRAAIAKAVHLRSEDST